MWMTSVTKNLTELRLDINKTKTVSRKASQMKYLNQLKQQDLSMYHRGQSDVHRRERERQQWQQKS